MSRIRLVAQLIVLLVFAYWVRSIDCDQNVANATAANRTDHQQSASEERTIIERRSGNIILDGIQYLPECGLLCKLHRLTSHLPPVMINFNHQYQHYVPLEPIPIPLHHAEMHHPDLHTAGLHQHELHHPELHHSELHHPELHHVELHHSELHHPELHSGLHLGLHSKLLPDLPAHHHQFGLPVHAIHPHLGLSSSFQQTAAVSPAQPGPAAPQQPLSGNQLQTSASTVTHRNNQDNNLDAIQKMFTGYESKYPVSIVEEHFPLPHHYGPLSGAIETHQSSVRPLFIPEKSELKSPGLPPYEVEDSRSTIIDYRPFHPRFPADHHFGDSPPHYHHPPPPPAAAFLHPPHHHAATYPPNTFFDKEPIPIYPKNKPNIEILKLNEQDYPLPPQRPSNATAYENLIADLHARIKDPTIYYQHPEPEKGSIVYADSELERRRPPTSKIDENSVLNIGQNYGRVKHIQEQLNSMKRQFPEEELPPPPVNYHHRIHHHEMSNSHFGSMEPALHRSHIEAHRYNPPHLVEHYQPPILIEEPPRPPMHLGHHQSFSLPGPQPKSFKKPIMEFNGFYSNFYSQLPPAPPPHYSHYGR